MDGFWKATLDAYMAPIYNANPQGELLINIKTFEADFNKVAEENAGNMDIYSIMMSTGLQDRYTKLYMAAVNGTTQTQPAAGNQETAKPTAKLPTVREFLNNYRLIYDDIKQYNRIPTNRAYEKLLEVEQRTDDLIEAQIIMEQEKLVLNTLIADYKAICDELMQAIDPNYEVVSGTLNAGLNTYVTAKSIDEIIYLGELSRAKTDDIAVQVGLKLELFTLFASLIFSWENAKRKVREGGVDMPGNAASMVFTREKIRECYSFLTESLGIDFDKIENTPFYRILLLLPSGLDAYWRIKKVMHPDNIKATKYVLFEEILSDKTMQEILLTPQAVPYYLPLSTKQYPALNDEYIKVARELNKGISLIENTSFTYSEETNPEKKVESSKKLISNSKKLQAKLSYKEV